MDEKFTSPLFSVKELSDVLKACFDRPEFHDLRVYGEIYSIKKNERFVYIDIGDQGQNQISSPILHVAFALFRAPSLSLGLDTLKRGDVIEVTGDLTYYQHGSSLTLWGSEIRLLQSQQGRSLLLKQEILKRLDALGYLDKKVKRDIPRYCKRVAIITARDGAAYQDILKTLHDRFPVDTVLFPCQVQGEQASASIVRAIKEAEKESFDCLIIGRGGGSKTDLSCFDDERVCLAIAECPFPTITCIGHTIDIAIADRVSDYQAITPTEAAGLINPSLSECREEISEYAESVSSSYSKRLYLAQQRLDNLISSLENFSPSKRLKFVSERLVMQESRLSVSYSSLLTRAENELHDSYRSLRLNFLEYLDQRRIKLNELSTDLRASDPSRFDGLARVFLNGKRVSSISEIDSDDVLDVSFQDGEARVVVKEVHDAR